MFIAQPAWAIGMITAFIGHDIVWVLELTMMWSGYQSRR